MLTLCLIIIAYLLGSAIYTNFYDLTSFATLKFKPSGIFLYFLDKINLGKK
jgi:hypothetical protein